MDFIAGLQGLSYEERAQRVLGCFLTDYSADEIQGCVQRAYGGGKFDSAKVAPLTMKSRIRQSRRQAVVILCWLPSLVL